MPKIWTWWTRFPTSSRGRPATMPLSRRTRWCSACHCFNTCRVDMTEHPILGQVVLGYSPMIDRQRAVIATRLTVYPARPDTPVDAAALLAAVTQAWPDTGGKVSLNV